ncbi:MAG: AAA family ATPase [Rikenellaceae bacterium]|nr:AAA family ATPase [Rikenellaceae bacterium]
MDSVQPVNGSTDYIGLIGGELAKAKQLHDQVPEHIGMFTVKTANQTIKDAALRPDPPALWLSLWYEGEVCCLFADSNLGKSIYATQIAAKIAEKQKVLYFDFELSDKQFQMRYTDEHENTHRFPENLLRSDINRESLDMTNFEDAVIENIEKTALQSEAKVLIIDNLSFLCLNAEKGDVAGKLMFKLTGLKKKHDLSILVIAHTPKRQLSNPITQNDLAGSKRLFNFFDSVFAIGKSTKDNGLRYIKQLKVRHGEYTYDSDNVIVASIEKSNSFLHFSQIGFATEREHLKEQSENDRSELIEKCRELKSQGLSQRQTAKDLSISLGAVNKYLKL